MILTLNFIMSLSGIWLFQEISICLWTTLIWVPKWFRISKKNNSSLCRISNGLNGFPGILVKIHKMLEKLTEFQSGSSSTHGAGASPLRSFCPCKFKILPPNREAPLLQKYLWKVVVLTTFWQFFFYIGLLYKTR